MAFDKEAFLAALKAQCQTLGLEHSYMWQLAPNVFAARIRPRGADGWTTMYYFDDREVKIRDEQSRKWQMVRTVQLRLRDGYTFERISLDRADHRIVWSFDIDMVGNRGENVRNYATNLFVQTNNGEIGWLREAEPISLIAQAA